MPTRTTTASWFSQTDFTEDLKRITVPVLVMHSEDDQVVPYVASGPKSAALLRNGILKTYQGLPHGMPTTHADLINADLLSFLREGSGVRGAVANSRAAVTSAGIPRC